jgi:hypothetical protein
MGLLDNTVMGNIWDNYWRRKEPQNRDTWGSQETDMNVSYDKNQVFVSPGKRYKIDSTGRQVKVPKKEPWYKGAIKKFQDPDGMTTSGSGGDIFGEGAIPGTIGEKTASMVLPVTNKKTGKVEYRVLDPRYVKQNKNLVKPKWDANTQKYVTQKEDDTSGGGEGRKSDGMDLSKYHGGDHKGQIHWWQTLANKMGIDFDKAAANWKEKGGFEGLMANPAFTMGLAFMQAGAEGKSIGQGALDNVMKAGGISQHYKKILKDRQEEPIQATAADMAEVESLLKTINIEEGHWAENLISKIKGGHPGAEWSAAVEEIAVKYQEKVRAAQEKLKEAGKPQILRETDKIKIMNELVKSDKITKKDPILWGLFSAGTIKKKLPNMARGGPVQAGKPYVVGEEGPEVIIPRSDGNVLSNDDSQIYAMLLASNPQLQQVSRARAEKILRSRFPEYFE